MDETSIKYVIEAALLASGEPLSIDQLMALFAEDSRPDRKAIRAAISELEGDYEPRGIMVAEVASGFRVQVRPAMTALLQPLWEERPPRYSRALFETLALIAYRQPITRGEIEEVRGVSVSPNIIRTLLDREWIRVLGHRDVPGRPEMFGTTKIFLDYFGLKSLDDLPPLAELQDIDGLSIQLDLPDGEGEAESGLPATVTPLQVARVETAGGSGADPGNQAESVAGRDGIARNSEHGDETGDGASSGEPDEGHESATHPASAGSPSPK